MHDIQGTKEREYAAKRAGKAGYPLRKWGTGPNEASYWNYKEARDTGVEAHKKAYPHCHPPNNTCIKDQLDAYHQDECKFEDKTPMRTDTVNRH
jgi:hypothetical protein